MKKRWFYRALRKTSAVYLIFCCLFPFFDAAAADHNCELFTGRENQSGARYTQVNPIIFDAKLDKLRCLQQLVQEILQECSQYGGTSWISYEAAHEAYQNDCHTWALANRVFPDWKSSDTAWSQSLGRHSNHALCESRSAIQGKFWLCPQTNSRLNGCNHCSSGKLFFDNNCSLTTYDGDICKDLSKKPSKAKTEIILEKNAASYSRGALRQNTDLEQNPNGEPAPAHVISGIWQWDYEEELEIMPGKYLLFSNFQERGSITGFSLIENAAPRASLSSIRSAAGVYTLRGNQSLGTSGEVILNFKILGKDALILSRAVLYPGSEWMYGESSIYAGKKQDINTFRYSWKARRLEHEL